jgi:RNA polymerase sigma factor (sigma-70 family)
VTRPLRKEEVNFDGTCVPPFIGSADATGREPERDFAAIVSEYRKPLYRFVLRHIGRPADAEDIAQQTFVEAYGALATFRGQSALSTWLYGIAMNLVRNYLNRAPHRVRKFESEEVLTTLPTDEDGPDALAQRMEILAMLYREAAFLSEDLRQVLLMVAIDGQSYEETAQLLNIPIGTVRSRLFRAREIMKDRFPALRDALRN